MTEDRGVPPEQPRAGASGSPVSVAERVVRAAGAVLWRPGADGRTEVAVVHRPRYDDWSLPKGKPEPGETPAHTAVREVTEETGFHGRLSRFLTQVRYSVPTARSGRADKVVDYFAAEVHSGRFAPNHEVDELLWLRTDEARSRLSYPHDSHVLDTFERLPASVATVLLVRHAEAGNRSEWSGDDALRPLSETGWKQRDALRSLLPLFGPERFYSAPRVRCEQTVRAAADDLGIGLEIEPRLSEEGYRADPQAGVEQVLRIAGGAGTAVISSQGGVIPDLVTRLAADGNLALGEVHSKKGSVWTLTFRRDVPPGNGSGPRLRLAAASYLADPLP